MDQFYQNSSLNSLTNIFKTLVNIFLLIYATKTSLLVKKCCLKVLTQLTNAEIARLDVMTQVRTRDLTVVCEFIFSGLPLHVRQKKNMLLD